VGVSAARAGGRAPRSGGRDRRGRTDYPLACGGCGAPIAGSSATTGPGSTTTRSRARRHYVNSSRGWRPRPSRAVGAGARRGDGRRRLAGGVERNFGGRVAGGDGGGLFGSRRFDAGGFGGVLRGERVSYGELDRRTEELRVLRGGVVPRCGRGAGGEFDRAGVGVSRGEGGGAVRAARSELSAGAVEYMVETTGVGLCCRRSGGGVLSERFAVVRPGRSRRVAGGGERSEGAVR